MKLEQYPQFLELVAKFTISSLQVSIISNYLHVNLIYRVGSFQQTVFITYLVCGRKW